MKGGTVRQSYLYLVARLSDLASEFTDAELSAILKLRSGDRSAIARAIEALAGLHDELAERGAVSAEGLVRDSAGRKLTRTVSDAHAGVEPQSPQLLRESTGSAAQPLVNILMDETLFPRISDVAALLPQVLAPRDKESRIRFAKRVAKYYEGLAKDEKKKFREMLRQMSKSSSGFVNRWSSAIKDL